MEGGISVYCTSEEGLGTIKTILLSHENEEMFVIYEAVKFFGLVSSQAKCKLTISSVINIQAFNVIICPLLDKISAVFS